MKLDLKDKKILYELDLNSRATLNEIAKKVGLSKQVVDYHLKNLIKNNVIQQFYTVINFSKLGYTQYKLYLKFQNVNPATEKEIIAYWINSKNSVWIASCRGRWDLAVSILAKDINDFGEILSNFINQYGLFVLEKDVLITQISPVFTKAYLTEKKEKKRFTYGREIEHYELDDIDIKILKIFSTNARMAILEMIDKLNLTRDVINYRMKKLTKNNIISQYRISINLNKINHKLYKIILRLHSLTPEKEKQLIAYIASHPHGMQYLKLVGSWDVELEFEVKDDEQLHDILLEIRNQFSEIIRDYDTLLINQEHKLNYYPF
ncbi:Lrp/AsnC family transcriptional regulator [Candidatus Woesearchaeota archaeon]|nr:Lrp/AsnC family transcriptional regulator [Candidatus Woesearchaeota archaeon]